MCTINLEFYNNKSIDIYQPLKGLDKNFIEALKLNPQDLELKIPPYIYYFVNPSMPNVYKWYPFNQEMDVLEINAAFGSITKFLCSKCKSVCAVESSKVNAEIIQARLSDCNNCEIIVAKFNAIKFEKKFDCIIVNDLFELASIFFNTQNGAKTFLEYLKLLLSDNGKILLTIPNRFGIEEWNGARSFISGECYDRMQGYPFCPFLKSYSEQDLMDVFEMVFDYTKIYYPIPTQYNAQKLINKTYLLKNKPEEAIFSLYENCLLNYNPNFDSRNLMKDLFDNDEFPFFVNAFLVIAGNEPLDWIDDEYNLE